MSEVHLYKDISLTGHSPRSWVHGYLTHTETPSPTLLQEPYAWRPRLVPGGWAVSCERGTAAQRHLIDRPFAQISSREREARERGERGERGEREKETSGSTRPLASHNQQIHQAMLGYVIKSPSVWGLLRGPPCGPARLTQVCQISHVPIHCRGYSKQRTRTVSSQGGPMHLELALP